ncbi:MAG: RagB/SusD family nutrient uptake outer membrane protein, partial [Lachnospiraceae bacterium]|nr:RagB/SusD family nutrient uptake outer membrane protein [Lachnospiraceae bacterium]
MKKILFGASILAVAATLSSCDDFLNDNRYPLDEQTNNPAYWNNPSNVQMQCDRMYSNYSTTQPGPSAFTGFSTGTGGWFYFQTLSDDQGGGISNEFRDWKFQNVPSSSSTWTDSYKLIRHANSIIEGVNGSTLSEAQKNKYIGIARLIRGWCYYDLVRCYGDVPYYDHVVDPANADDLYKARDNRNTVMDAVLEDLKFAAANIGNGTKITWSSDLAYAMLADIALWEGTFCKYCTEAENNLAPNTERSTKWLNECVAACEAVMAKGYSLSPDYQATYNTPENGLNSNPEIIFYRQYKPSVLTHQTINYIIETTSIAGLSKDAFDAYLFKDGKPLALTTCDKNDAGVVKAGYTQGIESGALGKVLSIKDLLEVRDARLSQTIDTVVCFVAGTLEYTYSRAGSSQIRANTGYTVKKYDNITIPIDYRHQSNYTSAPLYWLSVIYCNYAEAKAELGTLNDNDLNNTINKLYARAELPAQTVASLTSMKDPANNMNVSSLIWEVRRCRRCELIMDNNFRYWDMVRWHQLDKLDTSKYPNIKLGANIKNLPDDQKAMITARDGDYLNAIPGNERIYLPRVYTYPIP